MAKLKDMHRTPENPPLAYLITVRTYGTWLHGDERGSADRLHNEYGSPLVEPNSAKVASEMGRMKHAATVLIAEGAGVVERTIREVCAHRRWHLHEVAARSNHFHAVIGAGVTAERVMNDLKAWSTRRLRETGCVGAEQEVWTAHGSTAYLYTNEKLAAAINYVRNGQGEPLK